MLPYFSGASLLSQPVDQTVSIRQIKTPMLHDADVYQIDAFDGGNFWNASPGWCSASLLVVHILFSWLLPFVTIKRRLRAGSTFLSSICSLNYPVHAVFFNWRTTVRPSSTAVSGYHGCIASPCPNRAFFTRPVPAHKGSFTSCSVGGITISVACLIPSRTPGAFWILSES